MCCATCGTEYHKKCSGLTRHALLRWSRTHRQQGAAANQPGAPLGSGGGVGTDGEGNLLVCQWNVDGMATSLMDLRDLVKRKPATGVILVQESKLLPSDPDPSVPGFSTVRLDRPPSQGGTRGGGLLTFVRQDIPYRQVESFRRGADGAGLEALTVELKTSEGGCVTLTNVYRPPRQRRQPGRPRCAGVEDSPVRL